MSLEFRTKVNQSSAIINMNLIKSLYFWILIAFVSGCALGILNPRIAILMEPLGTSFIKLIKTFIGPIVFLTIINGIAKTGSLKKLGKIGIKSFIYFESISTIALLIGWAAALIIKPGSMVHASVNLSDKNLIQHFSAHADQLSFVDFIQRIIPSSLVEPFNTGNMLQILLISILFGLSLLMLSKNHKENLIEIMESLTQSLFKIIRMIMYTAPLGVFGAMSFTIAKFGVHFLIQLIGLIVSFYLSGLIFVFGILGGIAKISGFSILSFLKYMMPELFLVLSTSSSEAALPQLLNKLEKLGCRKETIGVVIPMGYAFNLDGTNIYITLAALFIAQALGIQLTAIQALVLFANAMLLSKGAAGVAGSGFITLAATLSSVPTIPVVGIVLILGIDRFMSEARSLINYIGNGVASLAITCWEKEISPHHLNQAMRKKRDTINQALVPIT
jgi:aerobic C4-dicarboxylate transport protein